VNILVGTIAKILHGQIKADGIVCCAVQLQSILGCQREVIVRIKGVQYCCGWLRSRLVVDQPARDVPVQTVRDAVK